MATIRVETALLRKSPQLPVYFVVPEGDVRTLGIAATAAVEVAAAGVPPVRRTIKRSSRQPDGYWYVELTAKQCTAFGLGVGDRLRAEIRAASDQWPDELARALAADLQAARRWHGLSLAQQRVQAEHVRAAVREVTRLARAQRVIARLRGGCV
jgi:hypothetical protein